MGVKGFCLCRKTAGCSLLPLLESPCTLWQLVCGLPPAALEEQGLSV